MSSIFRGQKVSGTRATFNAEKVFAALPSMPYLQFVGNFFSFCEFCFFPFSVTRHEAFTDYSLFYEIKFLRENDTRDSSKTLFGAISEIGKRILKLRHEQLLWIPVSSAPYSVQMATW